MKPKFMLGLSSSFVLAVALNTIVALTGCASSETKAPAPAPAALTLPTTIREAVASGYRTPENKNRDQYRHPAETLEFFGLQPNMTVVEISPSGGWYTEILAPLLAANGHYIGATRPASSTSEVQEAALPKWLDAHPEIKAKVTLVDFKPPQDVTLAPPNSVDMVVTFRNVHNWMHSGSEKAAFKAFYTALKPGGILGLVEHRADTMKRQDPKAESGYVREDYVIKLAHAAGFRDVTKSEINQNSSDTKNYPEGVWTLPPTYRLKDQDHAKYAAIGESDRMTLRFVKPAKKQ